MPYSAVPIALRNLERLFLAWQALIRKFSSRMKLCSIFFEADTTGMRRAKVLLALNVLSRIEKMNVVGQLKVKSFRPKFPHDHH